MSFGFSIGDFLVVSNLIIETVSLLRSSRSSPSDYQGLLAELTSLERALKHLDGLNRRGGKTEQIWDSIKFSAVTCRKPLEDFLNKIKQYDASLGEESTKTRLRAFPRMIQWQFSMKEECQKMQSYLNLHFSSINTLLLEYSLETMELDGKAVEDNQNEVKGLILETRATVDRVSHNLDAQTQLITRTSGAIESLIDKVTLWAGPWQRLNEIVSRICVSTQQVYTILLDMQSSMIDIRWTYFQAPLRIEDALGHTFLVPAEYDFALIQVIILERYSDGPLAADIESGRYDLSYANNSQSILSENTRLRPGSDLIMGVHIEVEDGKCLPDCGSTEFRDVRGGWKECATCGRRGDKPIQDATSSSPDSPTHTNQSSKLYRKRKRQDTDNEHNGIIKRRKSQQPRDISLLKNIRFRTKEAVFQLLEQVDVNYSQASYEPKPDSNGAVNQRKWKQSIDDGANLFSNTKVLKKTSYNMIERRYRSNLNDKIAALRDAVPSLRLISRSAIGGNDGDGDEDLEGLAPAHKLNKATVLSKATEYIRHLEKALQVSRSAASGSK